MQIGGAPVTGISWSVLVVELRYWGCWEVVPGPYGVPLWVLGAESERSSEGSAWPFPVSCWCR